MVVLLLLAAVLAAAGSVLFVSEATMGVWVMAGAILLAALARIAQAGQQHQEAMKLMEQRSQPPESN